MGNNPVVELEIDGQKIKAAPGVSIIEAADAHGIYIPRFCYHKHLSVAYNCRQCLVEVANSRKPLPACATPVTDGMTVLTQSKLARDAQRSVMEFLLINHPLDCPICDQGGECELQDLSMGFGGSHSQYGQGKRSVYSQDIGPLIETFMTRCIQCTRCVRFGEEIAGLRELGVIHRGEKEEIGTYVQHFLKSELSGNVIDLCPVGALTNKPFRYQARSWELQEQPMIAAHDCVGSHVYLHSRARQLVPYRRVMRAVPRENPSLNETWISDRDRYACHGLYHRERVYEPHMKVNGQWQVVDWVTALQGVVDRTRAFIETQGADQLAGLAAPTQTVEAFYLFQYVLRQLGVKHLDHRLRQHDFRDDADQPLAPGLSLKIDAIPEMASILLVGSHLRVEQPMLAHRVNMASQAGAAIYAINPVDYPFTFKLTGTVLTTQIWRALAAVAQAVATKKNIKLAAFAYVEPDVLAQEIADRLLTDGERALILLGDIAMHHPQASQIRYIVQWLQAHTGAQFGLLTEGPNSAGAWLMGMVPHRLMGGEPVAQPGYSAKTVLTDQPRRGYWLLDVEPAYDTAYPAQAVKHLQSAELVVSFSTFVTPTLQETADFILPMAPFTESGGTFVNVTGEWQSFEPIGPSHGKSKPAWQVLRALAKLFECAEPLVHCRQWRDIRDLASSHQSDTQAAAVPAPPARSTPWPLAVVEDDSAYLRLATWPIYRGDPLVRRSLPLQEAQAVIEPVDAVMMNAKTAAYYQLSEALASDVAQGPVMVQVTQGDQSLILPVQIHPRVADYAVVLPAATALTAGFGESFAPITVTIHEETPC